MTPAILTEPEQARAYDRAAMAHAGITSLELMERAATALADAIVGEWPPESHPRVDVLCGPGNNGGDGAAVARILSRRRYVVHAYGLFEAANERSGDLVANWERLTATGVVAYENTEFPTDTTDANVVLDALFGVGLSRPLAGAYRAAVAALNTRDARFVTVSVDVPSGQAVDGQHPTWPCVYADRTFSFVARKQASLLPDTGPAWGSVQVLQLGDDLSGVPVPSVAEALGPHVGKPLLRERRPFTHKGSYGHVLVIAGSRGHAGAALLCGRGAYRAGAGLVTFYAPSSLEVILQAGLPEAMFLGDPRAEYITAAPDLERYDAIALGPGLGRDPRTAAAIAELFAAAGPRCVVVDADALNLVADDEALRAGLPDCVVLTPHPGEFARLADPSAGGYERLRALEAYVAGLPGMGSTVVLKDQYTAVCSRSGALAFNTEYGNPGMATGGSGDVLTGVVAGLAAQLAGVSAVGGLAELSWTAAASGVVVHARAGDLAAASVGQAGLMAGDIADHVGPAIRSLSREDLAR